jgi:hypothetical protein
VWLWLAALGLPVAIFLPGLSPYFLLPTLCAGILLLPAARAPGGWDGAFGIAALFASALVALLVWSAIGASGEAVMGLKLHPLFTLPFAIGLSTLVPVFARYAMPRRLWLCATAGLFGAAICVAIVQGLEPSYSNAAAQRMNVTYFEDAHRAAWAADATAPLPRAMRALAPFSDTPRRLSAATSLSYVAAAGAPRFALPAAMILANAGANAARRVTLALHGSDRTAQMVLVIPSSAMLKAVDLEGWHFVAPDALVLACMSRDCASATVTLTLATRAAVTLSLYEHRFGLPDFAQRLVAARPPTAVQSQNGDGITLLGEVHIPGAR